MNIEKSTLNITKENIMFILVPMKDNFHVEGSVIKHLLLKVKCIVTDAWYIG